MNVTQKRIVLCADDYGQAEAVSKGIIELLKAGRLSATSCLVNMPNWPQHARWLSGFQAQADIGLHINLTEYKPVSDQYKNKIGKGFMPLKSFLWRAMIQARSLPPEAIEAEIHAQIDRFEQAMGFTPRFIDGHQHVHHLPVVRDALLYVYEDRLKQKGTYLRAVNQSTGSFGFTKEGIKKAIISYTGGVAFTKMLNKRHIPHNTSFSGVYPFDNSVTYREYFMQFLKEVIDGGLIMCHPGQQGNNAIDPIAHSRFDEYQYLMSRDFLKDCDQMGVSLSRFVSSEL